MGRRIPNPDCVCQCPCCCGGCTPEVIILTLNGVVDYVCNGCDGKWRGEWELALVLNEEGHCQWTKTDGLPCGGTLLSYDLFCVPFPGIAGVFHEAAIWEDDLHIGDWRLTEAGVVCTDCHERKGLSGFVAGANHRRQCDWTFSGVTIEPKL